MLAMGPAVNATERLFFCPTLASANDISDSDGRGSSASALGGPVLPAGPGVPIDMDGTRNGRPHGAHAKSYSRLDVGGVEVMSERE